MDITLPQALGCARVDSLHAKVGQLVGHIVIGAPDGYRFAFADNTGVGAAEVELLVDDSFDGAGQHRYAAEGHLTVATVEYRHQPDITMAITGSDRQFLAQVDTLKSAADVVIQGQAVGTGPAGQVDEAGIDIV